MRLPPEVISGFQSAAANDVRGVEAALNTVEDFVHRSDQCGQTALIFAVAHGSCDAALLLLQHGSNPNTGDMNGVTAMHALALSPAMGTAECAALIEQMIGDGGNWEVADSTGATPLCYAADIGDEGTIATLLKYGASPDVVDGSGNSPLHIAAKSGNSRVMKLLKESGAQAEKKNNENETPTMILEQLKSRTPTEQLDGFKLHCFPSEKSDDASDALKEEDSIDVGSVCHLKFLITERNILGDTVDLAYSLPVCVDSVNADASFVGTLTERSDEQPHVLFRGRLLRFERQHIEKVL